MAQVLNITNGDSAVQIMQAARLEGDFLPWRDVLHEGPVPGKIDLAALSAIRAQYIARQGWGAPEKIRQGFAARDATLASAGDYARVILWFEHDLYDQLQLLQILDWFHAHPLKKTSLSMICSENYLGLQSPDGMIALQRFEQPVSRAHLTLAARAWSAFRSDSPEDWQGLLHTDTAALPFLRPAVVRMLEEYPSCFNGLSRTAHQALEAVSRGESDPARVFAGAQALEKRRFIGDAGFWSVLAELLAPGTALLRLPEGTRLTLPAQPGQDLALTTAGRKVLAGNANWLDKHVVDRWIGGVHLRPGRLWCWDPDAGLRRTDG